MLKELRKIINRNTDHFNKELKTINRNQSKPDNWIAKINTKLKAMNKTKIPWKKKITGQYHW